MSQSRTPTIYDRNPGPSPFAAEDGLQSAGVYAGTLVEAPSGGMVKVILPGLHIHHYYLATFPRSLTGLAGDSVLVQFDDSKHPWVVQVS